MLVEITVVVGLLILLVGNYIIWRMCSIPTASTHECAVCDTVWHGVDSVCRQCDSKTL